MACRNLQHFADSCWCAPSPAHLPASPACLQILETKIGKLEQLVRLKDAKIQALLARLQAAAQAEDASVCSS